MPEENEILSGMRVLAALNGLELFGHERGNIEVFKALRDMGAKVMVGVNAQSDNHVRDELHRLGLVTFNLPFGPQWSIRWVKKDPTIALTNILAVLRCSWIYFRAIGSFKPTHIHLGSPLAYSYVSLALALNGTPLVYRMGDCPPVDSPFNLRIWRMAMRRSDRIVANSKFVRNAALAAGVEPRKISVIHNLAPGRAEESGPTLGLPVEPGQEAIVYVGQIAEHKGVRLLIEAFVALAADYPALRLDIVGGSRYGSAFRIELERLISTNGLQDRVCLHGYVSEPASHLKLAVLHVAPSLWAEPFANVVLEAKQAGTPSVIFSSGGLPEMVRHQVDGYICRERSAGALVEGLRWMLADPVRLKRMGEEALEDLKKRFGKQRFVDAWAVVYRAAIDS